MTTLTKTTANKFWQYALWLALFTIVYNLAEGLVSVYFGAHDEALTLFGFGLDSFIEVLSGAGILAMVLLAASLVYQFTGFGFVDSLGAAGLIYFSINEGREPFEKANGLEECGCEEH